MSAQVEFSFSAHCQSDAATVMRVLDDVDRWPSWARPLLLQAQWERWGEGSLGGPGAIRKLGAWPVWIRELILTRHSHGHTYTVVSPATFSHYLGEVSISDRPDGVDVQWRVEFTARHAALTPVLKAALKTTISGLLTRLVAVGQRESQAKEAGSPH
ncbi:SRPBCC family protein [Mycobacterium sp. NPDC051198]